MGNKLVPVHRAVEMLHYMTFRAAQRTTLLDMLTNFRYAGKPPQRTQGAVACVAPGEAAGDRYVGQLFGGRGASPYSSICRWWVSPKKPAQKNKKITRVSKPSAARSEFHPASWSWRRKESCNYSFMADRQGDVLNFTRTGKIKNSTP